MSAESFVVDFQAFKNNENEFILKELCIVGVRSNICVHVIIKSDVEFSSLSAKAKRSVEYLTNYYRKIDFADGYVSALDARRLILDTIPHGSLVYVKGSEKANHLRSICCVGTKIIDLDAFLCPHPIDLNMRGLHCPFYRHKFDYTCVCSFRKAKVFQRWVRKFIK